ncbi:7232_t:CDS:10 [Acaulospora morrowiae]|uniref:7232_t:CDS:1 n=1 Tax=Acaulospora morrowiae TaxID=94023 RepID=A0A9N8ZKP6_9GLOM|nr:7232_t:CDS:10 [Acaulospora morrowiae]
MDVESEKFERLYYAGPVTSLCFHNDTILFSGQGPCLKAFYVPTGELMNSSLALEYFRIHGIVPEKYVRKVSVFREDFLKERRLIAIYGSKTVQLVEVIVTYSHEEKLPDCAFNLVSKLPPLKDWVHDVCWLYENLATSEPKFPSELAIAFAHNFVEIWNVKDNSCAYSIQCEECCILYSARFFGENREGLILASGTVFNQVLLWNVMKKNEHGLGVVSKKFVGHEGVIFGVRFSENGRSIVSVSDDRTIRLWETDSDDNEYLSLRSAKPLVLYGHVARIWDCHILNDYLVSISEDSTCRVWKNSFNKNNEDDLSDVYCLACWEGHVGKNVWSLAINPSQKVVVTGGGDSGIRLWSLSAITNNKIDSEEDLIKILLPPPESYAQQNVKLPSREHVRNFVLIDYRVMVIATNYGYLLKHDNFTNEWISLYNSSNLQNYTMMKASECGRIVCCGSIDGHLYVISVNQDFQVIKRKLHESKIFEIFLEKTEDPNTIYLVSHAVQSDVLLLKLTLNGDNQDSVLDVLHKLSIPDEFLLMSLSICSPHNLLICGSRYGGLAIYDIAQSYTSMTNHPVKERSPIIYLRETHRKQSVTSVALNLEKFESPNDEEVLMIYTTGRDGCYVKYRLKGMITYKKNSAVLKIDDSSYIGDYEEEIEADYSGDDDEKPKKKLKKELISGHGLILEEVYRAKITKGWLEKALLIDGELILLGFYRKRFFVYNEVKKFEMFSVACGGAHRAWYFKAQDGRMDKANFMFVRKENVFIYHREDTAFNGGFNECELQKNFHGRECRVVRFLKVVPEVNQFQKKPIILASGAEDGRLRISQYINGEKENLLINLCNIKKHTSVIRSIEWSYGKNLLLFSSGASEELRCWKVEIESANENVENSDFQPVNVNCLEWASCSPMSDILETRIMDIAVHSIDSTKGIHLVAAGYSDSTLRIWFFDEYIRDFLLIGYARFHFKCILQVKHLVVEAFDGMNKDGMILFTSATDGRVAIFDISQLVHRNIHMYDVNIKDRTFNLDLCDPIYFYQAHQSGVNCIAYRRLVNSKTKQTYMIVTGGDDNSIAVYFLDVERNICDADKECIANFRLTIKSNNDRDSMRVNAAHGSSLQGICVINDSLILSTSLDQRLNLWAISSLDLGDSVHGWGNNQEIRLITSKFIDVCDPSSMDTLDTEESETNIFSITGIGIEIFKHNRHM